jgi:hypothetical protein
MTQEAFSANVFINCPFDKEYVALLRPILFVVIYCGLRPRIATERSDSGEVRIQKILGLIKESKYSIHDISRIEPLNEGDLPRFNMPFELGIDIGCRETGEGTLSDKRCLILEKEPFRYQVVLSDISGNDIKSHGGESKKAIRAVRNWLFENGHVGLPSVNIIWVAYNEFYSQFQDHVDQLGYDDEDIEEMPVPEFIYFVNQLVEPITANENHA